MTTSSRAIPAGFVPGAPALLAAWMVGLAIVRLTGAAAVVLLLVATLVGFIGSAISGWWRLRSVRIAAVASPPLVTSGDAVTLMVTVEDSPWASAPVTLSVLDEARVIDPTSTVQAVEVSFDSPGLVDEIDCTFRSAGTAGLLAWRRRQRIAIDTVFVAPVAAGPILQVDHVASDLDGSGAAGVGPKHGELDGARPWRPGEGDSAIHWPSTLRSGEIIAYDRASTTEMQWSVSVDSDPAQLRWTLEDGLRRGHQVFVTDTSADGLSSTGDADTDPQGERVLDADAAARWAAVAAHRSHHTDDTDDETPPWWKRQISLSTRSLEAEPVPRPARLLTGVTALLSLWMLMGALAAPASHRLLALVGVAVATGVSMLYSDGKRPWWARVAIVFIAAAALGRIAVQAAGIGGLLAALRGPMPDLLMLLVILHGAEIADKRTNRVHLALTGIVVAYSAGLRIDGLVGWWLLAWGIAVVVSTCQLDAVRAPERDARWARRVGAWTGAGAMATIAIAAFVPVPDGPASLGLPSISNDDARLDNDGALAGPDGPAAEPNSTGEPDNTRGALGQAGGYPGFSDTLDTAVRGDLGDEVVMRVRAPEPAFWRGQTFTEFDGRVWRVSDVPDERIDGPEIRIAPTLGDEPMNPVETEEFVQTFHVESNLPNVIFAAARAETIIFDGSAFARQDGAIRADRRLDAGTVYSVVSQRVPVTAESLRAQGDLGERFGPFADLPEVSQYLDIPESTTQATLDLAAQLRVEGSTYDTVRAYEAWMATNTQYDLNAPVPDGDAVDDFLFTSQRGFCEQIASSLVVMLRSQGVPARLATGYIPGTRDQISGVFEVRASDAHAWVEVWFPDSGWEAFDPTASVPLAGDAERTTVGSDAASALIGGLLARPLHIAAVLTAAFGALAAARRIADARRRRARGEWGLLHDRFMALSPAALTAPRVAHDVAERAATTASPDDVARVLDQVTFDPTFTPDDAIRRRIADDIATLEQELGDVAREPVPAS